MLMICPQYRNCRGDSPHCKGRHERLSGCKDPCNGTVCIPYKEPKEETAKSCETCKSYISKCVTPYTCFWEPKFKPFDLRIETEEEVETLWHRLNMPVADSFKYYCDEQHIRINDKSSTNLWDRLNAIYSPTATDGGRG